MGVWTVGIDLGKKASHLAVLVDETSQPMEQQWRFGTSAEEMEGLLADVRKAAPTGTVFRFVMEPTPTWRIVGGYLHGRGHEVCLVTAAQVHDMRKLLRRHHKSDHLDAVALAKLPYVTPDRVKQAIIPTDVGWQALKRGVKREHKLAGRIGQTKQTLEELAQEIMPGMSTLFPDPSSPLARLMYLHYARPETVVRVGIQRLHARLERALKEPVDRTLVERLHVLARKALRLHSVTGIDTNDLQQHIRHEIKILDLLTRQQEKVKERNFALYVKLDPQRVVMSLPGVGRVLAPALLLCKPLVNYLSDVRKLRAYAGWVPAVSASGQSQGKRVRMTKSGPSWLKRAIYLAAETARRVDPQLAAVYHRAMTRKGKTHTKAVIEVGAHLLDRLFCVLKENRHYEFRSLDGVPVTKVEARDLSSHWTVPEEVRRRLRQKTPQTQKQREAHNMRASARKAVPVCPPSEPKHNTHRSVPSTSQPERLGSILARLSRGGGKDWVVDNSRVDFT